jgi:hypothetical protein
MSIMRKLFFALLLLLPLTIPFASYGEEMNAGFVQGIWYSSSQVFVGVPTRVYVAFRNNTDQDLTGTIRFTDNDSRIGTSYISALPGRLVEGWADWTPTFGEHKIAATVSDIKLHVIGAGTENANVADMVAENTLTVDYDTDKDGIGNANDPDDDNDGVSDVDEKARGSDPLVPNPSVTVETQKPAETKADEIEHAQSVPETTPQGLETFVGQGATAELLSNMTEKINNAKDSLDTYREKRSETLAAESAPASSLRSSNGDTATITRSQIEPQHSFMQTFVNGTAHIFTSVWTGILWMLSNGLGHPAFLQFFSLVLILYILYRFARRVGRRPN